MIIGRVWKYGDNVNTDIIFPGRYTYIMMDETEMGTHALEDLDEGFSSNACKGDIIVAGRNWGCGSAREQAVKALYNRGIAAIVAESVSRIYFRNCLNEGLPVIICPPAVAAIKSGDTIRIDLENHLLLTTDEAFPFAPFDPFIQEMVAAGGLIPYTIRKLRETGKLD